MKKHWITTACLVAALGGCGGTMAGNDAGADAAVDPQLPPTTGRADIEAWLGAGAYRSWRCESASSAAQVPSVHGQARVCSNNALSAQASGGEFPVGSAAVIELYDTAGAAVVGYGVTRHVAAGSAPESWYFYERVPANSATVHDANGVVADGLGNGAGIPEACTNCHQGAGTAGYPGHNYVFRQVQ